MTEFQAAYIPIGVPTFHLESAQKEFEKSVDLLKGLDKNVAVPEKMLLSIPDMEAFLDTITPDLMIVQNITFANSAYISAARKRFDCPVLLWTLREPVIDGGRLRLNSLTGAYSAGNAMMFFKDGNFEYIFGSPTEETVREKNRGCYKSCQIEKNSAQNEAGFRWTYSGRLRLWPFHGPGYARRVWRDTGIDRGTSAY